MTVTIDGTISVSMKDYRGKNFLPYVYDKKGGEIATSFFIENDKLMRFPRNWKKLMVWALIWRNSKLYHLIWRNKGPKWLRSSIN